MVAVHDDQARLDGSLKRKEQTNRYRKAETVVLFADNLNTHTKASLYEACGPQEAKRIADYFEIHDTPKHGSWLNVAEIVDHFLQLSVESS